MGWCGSSGGCYKGANNDLSEYSETMDLNSIEVLYAMLNMHIT